MYAKILDILLSVVAPAGSATLSNDVHLAPGNQPYIRISTSA